MPPLDVNVRHIGTPRALLGGTTSSTSKGERLFGKRAKQSAPPKVKSQHKYKNDHVLTRTGRRGALVLGRLARTLAPPPMRERAMARGERQLERLQTEQRPQLQRREALRQLPVMEQ